MYLKKLEMLGFKSFADRTELVFQPGMTAVVGPNGCGKSNVVDAFKWIFGEQSAKGLRGSEMKDVIFNGTQERKPTGFAEVTIVFDNADRFLDIDYAEVAITRRLYRSGESEYLINKQRCRLKDIRELFMGTGIGQTSYSILEQGKIDVLLQSNQIDRRFIFEEAAGISRYLSKKNETVRALLRVEDNLTRLNDIVDEVEKRLGRVKAQASRARRFRELSDRLKELRIRSAIEDCRESIRQRADLSFRIYWLGAEARHLEGVGAMISQVLEEKAAGRRALSERLRDAREKLGAERMLIERTLERIDQERRRSADLLEEKEKKQADLEATVTAVETLSARLASERAELEKLSEEIELRKLGFTRVQDALEEARRAREAAEEDVRARKDALVALIQRRSRIANKLTQIRSEISGLESRRERLAASLEGFRAAKAQEEARGEAERCDIARLVEERAALASNRSLLEEAAGAIRAGLESVEARLAEELSFLGGRRSRLEVLKSLEENLEGVGRGVADILRRKGALDTGSAVDGLARDRAPSVLHEVHGMVASLARVEGAHARAVESALGMRAQSLVVETQDGALGLLDMARADGAGAVEVISLDRVDTQLLEHFPRQAGVLGPLREKVASDPRFGELFDRLLANIVLVEDFETALALSRNGLRPFRLVTLAGEVIEPWGGLSVGGECEIGLISRRSEMVGLEEEIGEAERRVEATRARQSSLREELEGNRRELDTSREAEAATERAMVEKQGNLSQVARELERLGRELAVGAGELEEIGASLGSLEGEKRAEDLEAERADEEGRALEESTRDAEARSSAASASETTASEALNQARLELAQAEKSEEGLREMMAREASNLAERESHAESLRGAMLSLARRQGEAEEAVCLNEADLEAQRSRETALSEVVAGEEAAERALLEKEDAIRRELENVRAECERIRSEREAAHLRDQEERHRRNSILERIGEEYGIDLGTLLEMDRDASDESAEPDPAAPPEALYLRPDPEWDRDRAREESREIQDKLRKLGGVNLEALDELTELEERHAFQLAQRADLLESEKNLRGIIGEINRTSREMFQKTFDEVQKHFSDLFRKCFEGGKAELVLEEGKDILEAGIDIVAKPPGKKITSLSLMSGGEKTMTTIALLFAIFRTRPGPFCILDEVDAPLDETNVRRFVVLLKDFVEHTQFVVVTHNKVTMAEANTLYGVTMEEHGVSKRVAVELETYDPERMAAAAR